MKLISYEGLGGLFGRWVRRGLLQKLKGFEITEYLWTAEPVSIKEPCIVVAHSFGVRTAIRTANQSDCMQLVLLDPRQPPWGTSAFETRNCPTIVFYRTGFMTGYPVPGAANIELKDVIHTQVPFQREVFEFVQGLV